jgi:ABC-type dipeptide/oligopeptide/nickel transport system ATPase component
MKQIQNDEHVLVVGSTGSGKSFLVESYLAGFQHVVKLDTKGEYYERKRDDVSAWTGLIEGEDFDVIFHLSEIDKIQTEKIIYVPDFEEQTSDYYNAFFQWCYERQNTTVWIDELMSIAESPQRYPKYLKAIATRGRSRNVSMWSLSQRPSDIPTIIPANITHFFAFNLNLPTDREKMVKLTGHEQFLEKPGDFNFWYFKNGSNNPIRARLKVST